MSWQADKRWSDQFLPHMKMCLGSYLIGEPNADEDAQRNTDLIVLKMDSVRIACRVRKMEYAERYAGEFTIREGRPSGVKTELTKIVEGWGDYFLYGFGNETTGKIVQWKLCDLKVFRVAFNRMCCQLDRLQLPGKGQKNADGSSTFRAFRFDQFPPEFVVYDELSHEIECGKLFTGGAA